MPKLSDITNNTRTVKTDIGELDPAFAGQTVTVTYRPMALTPELQGRLDEMAERRDVTFLAQFVSETVVDWDLLRDDGTKWGLDLASCKLIPLEVLDFVISICTNDIVGKAQQARAASSVTTTVQGAVEAALNGGSLSQAPPANGALTGTPSSAQPGT